MTVAMVAANAVEVFEGVTPFLALLIPPLVALLSKGDASGAFKRNLSLVITAAIVGLSVVVDPPDVYTFELLATRFLAALGESQLVYSLVNNLVGGGLNKAALFMPDKGLG